MFSQLEGGVHFNPLPLPDCIGTVAPVEVGAEPEPCPTAIPEDDCPAADGEEPDVDAAGSLDAIGFGASAHATNSDADKIVIEHQLTPVKLIFISTPSLMMIMMWQVRLLSEPTCL